jgi:hypothetical protein
MMNKSLYSGLCGATAAHMVFCEGLSVRIGLQHT